ncbi:unnamed protein product, partial [Staurois parvus]
SSNGRPYSTLSQNGTHQQCKRPESGTWQKVAQGQSLAMKSAAMGGRTGTHDTLWTWQQQEEAPVQGAMNQYGPGSSVRRPESGTWRAGWREAAVFGRHTQD